jgi:chorismate-pyruvate lyase
VAKTWVPASAGMSGVFGLRAAISLVVALLLAACAHGDRATVEALNARLLANPSATATLEGWCAERRLAEVPRIVARRGATDRPATAEVRAALRVGADEPVRYRQVQLMCGTRVLSEADNWYVPALLTPEMNRTLETTDTPFGRAVAALNFTRRTLSVRNLMGRGAAPAHVLEHRAVLSTAAGAPFSLVVERYTDQVLAH